MKKIYKKYWLLNLKTVATLAALLFTSGLASAQLSGAYTVDAGSASSLTTKNFMSFGDLADSLSTFGVSGAVTVDVTNATYSEQVQFDAIFGASASNSITINGNGAKITTSSGAVVIMNGADYITFDDLVVEATGTSSGTRCFWFKNSSDYNVIQNSELIISSYTSTSSYASSYVAFSNSTTGNSAGNHGMYNSILSNNMSNGTSTSAGPWSAVHDYRSSGNSEANLTVEGNDIQDVYYAPFYLWYVKGFNVAENNVHEDRNSSYFYPVYAYYAENGTIGMHIDNNSFTSIDVNYYFYGIYLYRSDATGSQRATCNGNYFAGCNAAYYVYAIRPYWYTQYWDVNDNEITGCDAGYYVYGVYNYYQCSNNNFDGNYIHGNSATYGVYGLFVYYYPNNVNITNNVYANNEGGYYNYGIYTGYYISNLNIAHNTIVHTIDVDYYNYGIYCYAYQGTPTTIHVKNNILHMGGVSGNNYYHYGIYAYYSTSDINWGYNVIYDDEPTAYYTSSGAQTTWAGWQSASGNYTSLNVDPQLTDIDNGDYTPQNPIISNIGESGFASVDFNDDSRTACGPDPGAFEFYVDHNVSNLVFTGTNECGNYSEPIEFDFNNGTSVAMSDVPVYYSINGNVVNELIPSVAANGTTTYQFTSVPVFNEPGVNVIEVGLSCDDNDANNTLTHNITITASPSGGDMVEATTFEGYFNDGDDVNPDISVPNTTSVYDVVGPTKYASSGTYGVDWEISDNSMTSGGMPTSGLGIDVDETNGLTVTVDPDASLTDSMVYVSFVISDLNTGCDSIVGRWMYIPFVPVVDFDINDVCLGDVAKFKNQSTMGGKDFMIYKWRYNDPNATDDTSEIKDGFWDYVTYGNYTVDLEVQNQSYPKFVYSASKSITVTPTPETDFSITNACEGEDIQFTDLTTSPVTGAFDYTWKFGDGFTSNVANPTHVYATPVDTGYDVSLKVIQNGCAATVVKTAYQFAKPVADFSTTGACNFEDIQFDNATTIAIGKSGYTWDFGDGGVSTLKNPTHTYDDAGTHSVTLKAYSEFGCEDEVTIDVILLESPEADFTVGETCNLTPVDFTSVGSVPAGIATSYDWDFNGEGAGTGDMASYLFSEVGAKTVTLTVSSANGCSDEITEEIMVVLQAVADFDVEDICEGEEAVFTNKSSVAAGDLTYTWDFGEQNATSDFTSPRFMYETKNLTRDVNVTLTAEVAGGCNAELTKTITINAAPDASFTADADGRNLIITGVDQNHTVYQWRFGDGGRSQDANPTWVYENVDKGEFVVCLSVKNDECWNEHCETVNVDLLGVEELTENNTMINVYPNPSTGVFNLEVENATDVTIAVADILGNQLDITVSDNLNGKFVVDMSTVADGVYFVQVKNGDYFATKRITVSK